MKSFRIVRPNSDAFIKLALAIPTWMCLPYAVEAVRVGNACDTHSAVIIPAPKPQQ